MALPFAYRAPAPPMFASGQSQQNQIYQALSSAPPGYPTPTSNPYDTSFGQIPGEATNPQAGSGDLPGPGVAGGAGAGPPIRNTNPTQSVAAQPPPNTSTAGASTNTTGGGGMPLDFSGDPILAQIRAYNTQNIANAEAAALARRKQAEIGYGYDPNFQYEDQSTQEAARQNPFSTLAQLLFNHGQRSDALTENLNKANLFYSGERIKQTGLEGRQYTLENANANSALQNLMGQIAQGVLDAKLQAQQSELGGEQAAYDRALQFALANNTGYPGGGGGAEDATAASVGGNRTVNNGGGVHASSQHDLPTNSGWGVTWTGPGTYAAVKFPPTTPGGGSDT